MAADHGDPRGAPTLGTLLRAATDRLRRAGTDSPETDALLLLAHVCGCARSQLRLRSSEPALPGVAHRFEALLDRRLDREPLPYILGTQEFMGFSLHVDARVLIPRPETEVLVEAVSQRLWETPNPVIADLGCGSGAIAIALARALPGATVHAVDVSVDALEVARINCAEHGLDSRVVLHQGDLFQPLRGSGLEESLAAVVSNPPYVADEELGQLQPEIARFEPMIALCAGADGMAFHRRIAGESRDFLVPEGLVALEVGLGQAPAVVEAMRSGGCVGVEAIPDLGGIERVVLGRRSQ